jgi:hypothetical protein
MRIVAVFLALAAMLCVSAASLSAAHSHHMNQPADRCSVCCTAHMTASEVAVIHVIHAPEARSFESPLDAATDFQSRTVRSSLTRGPPSLL